MYIATRNLYLELEKKPVSRVGRWRYYAYVNIPTSFRLGASSKDINNLI